MVQNPDVLADFVYRSIHTNVVVGKEITKMFYGAPHNTSDVRLVADRAQDFPDDFDGVLAD
ncbi:hypothetical protein BT96DRAFT_988400 [Gymnopus androsaceus JB14]|uniref:Uncharacterized protein n=1 Tax=Gymnopus androsaceus JB14 TaxID=1447944 RepID=A0A6A4I4E1_9AGAR|nr:hypothetical protein BT96DRAFT_988400 [Gymnopus androsaceus JB14]